jgi:hypothetical protein
VNGHEGHQGLRGQDFPVGPLIEDLGFAYQDPTPFPEDPGPANQTMAIRRLQEIDFKFDGQNAVCVIHQTEGGITGRMVGHSGQDSRMNVLILLPMAV